MPVVTSLKLILAMAALMSFAAPALGVELTDPRTGKTFTYRPSFVERPKVEEDRPQYRFFDAASRKWVTYQATREEMRERHRMKYARAEVRFVSSEPTGTVIVDTTSRYLYFLKGDGTAIRYGIGVGREGFTWAGVQRISKKAEWPDWRPPAEMREREPWLPEWMPGGPENPLGARALYLGSTLYRIHGTTHDETIGYAVSSGCIRMLNEDVSDLYSRVKVGTEVVVLGPNSDRSGLLAALSGF
ncbi:L,D-transpeptidase [Acuticoccus mangrovi]|uniref:L,D-transpeptidase n=1 Tax=Acuticoccus mangrovi TaxID=2796142 RepID=A0A934ML91_9HYPH|nr:L,D-transpeptidase [Acuticoccus mangrovi]MBJ3776159.1 L,D-transpeptidase [Acuticoccus mangrovi]